LNWGVTMDCKPARAIAYPAMTDAAPRGPRIANVLDTVRTRDYPRLGGRKKMLADIEQLHTAVSQLAELATPQGLQATVDEMSELIDQLTAAKAEADAARVQAEAEAARARTEAVEAGEYLAELREEVIATEDTVMLQEVGVYQYRHALEDAAAYADRLKAIRARMKEMVKEKTAVTTTSAEWHVNNSAAKGRKMINDTSKLLLRAYNSEAAALVDKMRPFRLDAALDKIDQSRRIIDRLGAQPMEISIAADYHRTRRLELELVADWLAKKEEEKEAAKEERSRLREEAKARKEIEAERERLRKEQAHYQQTLASLRASSGSAEDIAALEVQLQELDSAIETVDYRAANIRAGYVYVISNIGSFGERMVKIGMTRRLEPMDRVKELGDASVPFGYDLHALVFAEDAVDLETRLHRHFADKRVNLVNLRREFFYITPGEFREALPGMGLANIITEFHAEALAEEWRTSETTRQTADPEGLRVPTHQVG